MAAPLKNTVYDKIKESGAVTDADLYKALAKEGIAVTEDRYNKLLLDLEIMGLIRVAWITKDERRIEVVEAQSTEDESQSKTSERDYEASFPGFEK